MGNVFRGASPSKGEKRVLMYSVLSPPQGESWVCTSLEATVLGLPCHWKTDKRTGQVRSTFCRREMGKCEGCSHNWRELWQGFLGVYNHTLRQNMVLRLGAESGCNLDEFSKPYNGLMHVLFKVKKPSLGPTSALIFERILPDGYCRVQHTIDTYPSVCLVLGTPEIPDYRYTAEEIADMEGVK